MVFVKWFFAELNHTLKIAMYCPEQDICLVVSCKDWSLDRCYSHCISPPLEDIISALSFDAMMYAENTQLYIFMCEEIRTFALENLTLC